MKKFFLLAMLAALLLAGCGAGYGSPDGVVRIYVEAIKHQNHEKELEAVCRKDREEYKARNSRKLRRVDLPPSLDVSDLEFGQPVINSDGSASVVVTARLQNGKGSSKKTVVAIEEDGQWRVSVDKTRELQREMTGGTPRDFRDGKEE